MADRLATTLGIESTVLVSMELLVPQDKIRSMGKNVDTLIMELDQQAFEAYLSSDSEGFAAGRTCRTLKTGSPMLSPVHVANHGSVKQSPEALELHCSDLPTVIGGSSALMKGNR